MLFAEPEEANIKWSDWTHKGGSGGPPPGNFFEWCLLVHSGAV